MSFELLSEHIKKRLGNNKPDNLDFVLSYFKLSQFKKRERIMKFDEICYNVYYVVDGCVQISYNDDGNIWTRDIIESDNWCCSLESFMNVIPSNEEFVCLEDTIVLSIDKEHFDILLKEVPNFAKVFQLILSELYIENINRIKYVLSQSANNRIKWFYENKHHLTQKVSSLVMASYLHLHKDVFSKLRPKVLKELQK